jgi:plastocyanin
MRQPRGGAAARTPRGVPIVALVAAGTVLAACTSGSSTPPPTATTRPGSASPSAGPPPSPPAGPFSPVSEADYEFTPARIVVGTDQGLRIQNAGPSLHNLSVSGSQVDLDTAAGQTTRTEAIGGALKPGTYPFFCKYHRSRGMVGVLIVVQS